MNLPEWSSEQVTAQYTPTRIPAYCDNLYIQALGPIWTREQVMQKLIRRPIYKSEFRNWDTQERIHMTPDVEGIVTPLSANIRFEQLFSIMIRQGYVSRWGKDFFERIKLVDKIKDKMLKLAENGKVVGSTQCSLVHGITGLGKTTMAGTTMSLYPGGVYVHASLSDGGVNNFQIPVLPVHCPHDASVAAIVENIFDKLSDMVDEDLLKGVKGSSVAKLLPHLVKNLVKHSVGMLIIDEAQVIASKFSGGNVTLLYFWINLMNAAGVPLMLLANPEILDITGRWAKAGMRFCSGGEMALYELPRYGEWQTLLLSIWPFQYTKNETKLTEEIADEMYRYSAGIPRATMMLYKFVQQMAINEKGHEIITPDTVQRAALLHMGALQEVLVGIRKNTVQSRSEAADDLGLPSPVKTQLPVIKTPAPVEPSVATERVSAKKGALPPPRAKRLPKRGKVAPTGLISYLDEKVRGQLSLYAAMLQDGIIKQSTEFL